MKNIYGDIPEQLPCELIELLAGSQDFRIERIVSRGHRSPDGFWYDQDQSEFVLLLRGSASIRFKEPQGCIDIGPGDYINIEPHRLHRVESTDSGEDTVWLAVFY
jgi:cupin 2 domain-containing protein